MGIRPGKLKRTPPSQPLSAHRRGYTRQYRKFRALRIQQNPLCADCGQLPDESEIHHKRKILAHPELATDPDNVLHLCADCHRVRTRRGE